MIVLHRLGHEAEPFHLNPDLIQTVEATPDTVVTLTTGVRMVVAESPEEVEEHVREWRVSLLSDALRRRRADRPRRPSSAPLRAVEEPGSSADHPGG